MDKRYKSVLPIPGNICCKGKIRLPKGGNSRFTSYLLLALLPLLSVINRAVAQTRTTEAVVRSVADHVISRTSFQFIDPSTNILYPKAEGVSADIELKVNSRYNSWEYANGVLNVGMLELSRVLNDGQYAAYSVRNFDFIFTNAPQFEKRYATNPKAEWAALFRMKALDDCGALATALLDVNQLHPKKEYQEYLEKVGKYILYGQSRLKDSTLSRIIPRNMTLWADDLYMSVPFLARMGKLTGDQRYFDDAIRQVTNFNRYLFDAATGLYFHCWFSDVQANGVAHWLRCNGWVAMAQIELLNMLPAGHPKRGELTSMLLRQIIGFSRYQDQTGLWHQLIDRPDSYLETSGTAMFIYTVARAVGQGWIPASYLSIAREGWKGLAAKITTDGEVQDVCVGTGIADHTGFYYNRPRVLNDFHAIGAVLLAGTAMIEAEKKVAK